MYTPRISLIGRLIGSILAILLLLFLGWLEIIPGHPLRDVRYNVEAGFQRERSQVFVNSVYTLQYRPIANTVEAIRDLEITLPEFQREQAFLWTNPDPDVQKLLLRVQPAYLSLVTTVSIILAHTNDSITSKESNALYSDFQFFFTSMNILVTILHQDIQKESNQLLLISLLTLILCLSITFSMLIFSKIYKSQSSHTKSI